MRRTYTLHYSGKTLELGRKTCLMGILNLTPDSFSDGGKFHEPETAIHHALTLCDQGAAIIDLGGQSTRPGAEPVDAKEELRRVLPVLKEIRKRTNVWLSVDTYRSEVAKAALDEGA